MLLPPAMPDFTQRDLQFVVKFFEVACLPLPMLRPRERLAAQRCSLSSQLGTCMPSHAMQSAATRPG